MPEIQEQVEEYAKEQLDFPDEQLPGLYNLLQSVVEECCKIMKPYGSANFLIDIIRRDFAWLLEK